MKNLTSYEVTEMGREYTRTNDKTARGLVRAFEKAIGDTYEIDGDEYFGHELPYRLRLKQLERKGLIKRV